jgi:hypothetical protein
LAGGTGAFFSSGNTSSGNTFANGILDLKIDNESYVTSTSTGNLIASPFTSWAEVSSLIGKYFFKFIDLKPGDVGEDTISLHVANNAWVCMSIKETSTPENGLTEPEASLDATAGAQDGELQNYLYFTFWGDDGDNVYETGEQIFKSGLTKDIFTGSQWALADSQTNVWGNNPKYIPSDAVKYIGKAWCFGTQSPTPVAQDGKGKLAGSINGPLVRGTGFSCTGVPVGNIAQSDGISVDVTFSAEQARGNSDFLCEDGHDGGDDGDDEGDEYCSHGYWKQSHHFDSWENYSPNQQFSSVFDNAFPGQTLLQVLQNGGGGLNLLGRETVGALLNAGALDFPYTQGQVISMFNATYPGSSGAYTTLTNKFTLPENCPLD